MGLQFLAGKSDKNRKSGKQDNNEWSLKKQEWIHPAQERPSGGLLLIQQYAFAFYKIQVNSREAACSKRLRKDSAPGYQLINIVILQRGRFSFEFVIIEPGRLRLLGMWATCWPTEDSLFDSLQGLKISYFTDSRQVLGPIHFPIQGYSK